MKVAIVADWLTSRGGAEKVVEAFAEIFPKAPIYTSIIDESKFPKLAKRTIGSFLNKYPWAKKKYRMYLPWMPQAFESFDLSEYDVVLSSAHSCAKGIITSTDTLHISYCHSPMRYAWDGSHEYIDKYPWPSILKRLGKMYLSKLRMWDRLAADRVDVFVGNSNYIKNRIKKYYKSDAAVIYPFVIEDRFNISENEDDYYLASGRLIQYKRFDLVVDAFNENGKKLVVLGTGQMLEELKKRAKPNIEFRGYVSNKELATRFSEAKALIFPQIEDFGIIPLEAMASGTPVIAFAKGGALETVVDKKTGMFFDKQTPESLNKAIKKFEKMKFDKKEIRKHALKFSKSRFKKEIKDFVVEQHNKFKNE